MTGRPSVSLRGLRTFCVAARHESFSAAAEELYITPSAVSHQIRSLEEELGLRLFARSARELKLTDVGESMFEDVNPLIERLDSAVSVHRQHAPRAAVRMSVQPFFASEFFVPRLGEFSDEHPDIDIQVAATDETAESHSPNADLSIRLFRAPPAGVDSRLLLPLRLAPAGSAALAKSLSVKDGRVAGNLPLVIHESFPNAWKQWAKAAGISLPKDSKVTRLDSMIAVGQGCRAGHRRRAGPGPHRGSVVRPGDDRSAYSSRSC